MNVTGRRHKLGDRPPAPRTPFWKCRGCSVRVPLRVVSRQNDGTDRIVKTGRCPRCNRHREMTDDERTLLTGGYVAEFKRDFPSTIGMVYHFVNRQFRERRGFVPRDDLLGPMMVKACYAAMTYADPKILFSTYLAVCLQQRGDRDVYVTEPHLSLTFGDYSGEGMERAEADRTHETVVETGDARDTIAMLLHRANLGESRTRVIRWRYGMDGESLTLSEIGQRMGFSKERARQLEISAVERLRRMAEQEGLVGRMLAS